MIDMIAQLNKAQAIAGNAGLSLKLIEPANPNQVPRTDGALLYLTTPSMSWTEKEWNDWFDIADHETGHNLDSSADVFTDLPKDLDMGSLRGLILNLVDDSRNDRYRCKKYLGMMQRHKKAMPRHLDKLVNAEHIQTPTTDKALRVIQVMLPLDILVRTEWNENVVPYPPKFIHVFDDEQEGQWSKLLQEYFNRYLGLSTVLEELDFVDDVLANVFDLDPESSNEPLKPEPEKGKPGEKGEKGEKGEEGEDTEPGEESDEEGEEEGDEGDSEGEGQEGEGQEGESNDMGGTFKYKDILASQHDDQEQVKNNTYNPGKKARIDIDYDYDDIHADPDTTYVPHTPDTSYIIDVQARKGVIDWSLLGYRANLGPEADKTMCDHNYASLKIGSIVGKAKRLLQVNTRTRTTYNVDTGKIQGNKLHRLNGPDKNMRNKVFKRKVISKSLDCAFSMLIDVSGSMTYRKIDIAIPSAQALSSLCAALQINHEIACFTEMTPNKNAYFVAKAFNKPISESNLQRNLLASTGCMSANADGDSILIAYHRILQQKNARKVIVVLSDGQPAGYRGNSACHTYSVVKGIEKDPRVDIIALGLLDDSVVLFYNNHQVINNIENLPNQLIESLKNCIV